MWTTPHGLNHLHSSENLDLNLSSDITSPSVAALGAHASHSRSETGTPLRSSYQMSYLMHISLKYVRACLILKTLLHRCKSIGTIKRLKTRLQIDLVIKTYIIPPFFLLFFFFPFPTIYATAAFVPPARRQDLPLQHRRSWDFSLPNCSWILPSLSL